MRKWIIAGAIAVAAALGFGMVGTAEACASGDCGTYAPRCKYSQIPWRANSQNLVGTGGWTFPWAVHFPTPEWEDLYKIESQDYGQGVYGGYDWFRLFETPGGSPVPLSSRWRAVNIAYFQDVLYQGGATSVPHFVNNDYKSPNYGYYNSATATAIAQTEAWWGVGDGNGNTLRSDTADVLDFIAALQANEC